MARPTEAPTPRRSSSGGGGGWIFLVLLVGAAAATFVFAGDKVRGLLGISGKPGSEGGEPTAPADVTAKVVEKTPPDSVRSGDVATRAAEAATPIVTKPAETQTIAKPQFKDQSRAEQILGEAEKAYKGFKWDSARNLASGVTQLDAKQATLTRARDIAAGAVEIANLFKGLGEDKDELVRNFDTSPSLVQIGTAGNTMLAVPVSGDDNVVVEQDPVGYIRAMGKTGSVKLLVKGRKDFIATTLDTITDVALVDQGTVHLEKQVEFDQKLAALRNSNAARDALSWYEAAKFAYRNRLDDKVTELLDQALELDPFLVKSVREDKAAQLYGALIFHLKNKNQKQADAYMASIRKRYADTDQGKQAQAYYDGRTQELLAMAGDEQRKRKEADEARRTARIEKAKTSGDDTKVKAIEEERPVEEPAAPVTTVSGNATEGQAQQRMDEGAAAMKQAGDMPATPQRNDVYHKAYLALAEAGVIFQKLYEQTHEDRYQIKMTECNQMKFWSHKLQAAW